MTAIADYMKEPPYVVEVLSVLCGLITAGVTIPVATGDDAPPSPVGWAAWSAVLGAGVLTFIGVLPGAEKGTPGQALFKYLIPFLTAIMGITQLAAFVVDWVNQKHHDFEADWSFGLNVASTLPLLVNPGKLLGGEGRLVVAIVDGLGRVIVGILLMGHAFP